jgi:ABC-type multidrug transport system ATPase subunit
MDHNARRVVHETLREHVAAGSTVLMATNVPSEITPDVDAVILLQAGTVARMEHFAGFQKTHCKIRLALGQEPPLGAWPCGRSSDGRLSCVLAADHPDLNQWERDRRALTPEDMVSWLMQKAVRA